MQGGENAIVGLLQSDHLESADVIDAMEFTRRTGPKGRAPDTDLTHLFNNVSENVLKVREGPVRQQLQGAIGQPCLPQLLLEALQEIPVPT